MMGFSGEFSSCSCIDIRLPYKGKQMAIAPVPGDIVERMTQAKKLARFVIYAVKRPYVYFDSSENQVMVRYSCWADRKKEKKETENEEK